MLPERFQSDRLEGRMKFLHGSELTKAIRSLVRGNTKIKLAIAYWGSLSLDLLKVNPNGKNVEIVCCLKGGKSDPNIIQQFGSKARQNDRLHAKVIWTQSGAVVSSANASSNGLPEEEQSAIGLIEAGIYVDRGNELAAIRKWFDRLYREARPVRKVDLDAAQRSREQRTWGNVSVGRRRKRFLIEALADGGKLEFSEQRIYFVLWTEVQTVQETQETKRFLRRNAAKLEGIWKMPRSQFTKFTWYADWGNVLPQGAILISCEVKKNLIRGISVHKTLDVGAKQAVKLGGEREQVIFALESGFKGFNYRVSKSDKNVIRACSMELWSRGRGDQYGRVISLLDAAPILLKRAGAAQDGLMEVDKFTQPNYRYAGST
jgi:hypothetical protein